MHKILQSHFLCAFVANLKIGAIYALYPESFCDKNLAIRKVFAFCDSGNHQYKLFGTELNFLSPETKSWRPPGDLGPLFRNLFFSIVDDFPNTSVVATHTFASNMLSRTSLRSSLMMIVPSMAITKSVKVRRNKLNILCIRSISCLWTKCHFFILREKILKSFKRSVFSSSPEEDVHGLHSSEHLDCLLDLVRWVVVWQLSVEKNQIIKIRQVWMASTLVIISRLEHLCSGNNHQLKPMNNKWTTSRPEHVLSQPLQS